MRRDLSKREPWLYQNQMAKMFVGSTEQCTEISVLLERSDLAAARASPFCLIWLCSLGLSINGDWQWCEGEVLESSWGSWSGGFLVSFLFPFLPLFYQFSHVLLTCFTFLLSLALNPLQNTHPLFPLYMACLTYPISFHYRDVFLGALLGQLIKWTLTLVELLFCLYKLLINKPSPSYSYRQECLPVGKKPHKGIVPLDYHQNARWWTLFFKKKKHFYDYKSYIVHCRKHECMEVYLFNVLLG